MKTIIKKLKKLGACDKALEWLATQPNPQTAWDNCERISWMAWLLGRTEYRSDQNWRNAMPKYKRSLEDPNITVKQCADILREYHPQAPQFEQL